MPRRHPKQRPPQPRPRTRTFGGCLTCRVRKVKCGQERPSCTNCTRLQLTCRGYQSQLHWLLVDPAEVEHQGLEPLEPLAEAQRGPDARQDKMRSNIFTLDERRAMANQMLQPFSGQNLEEGLANCIGDLDQFSATSGCATNGPFGVFNLKADKVMDSEGLQTSVNALASPMLLDSHLLDWLASTFNEYNVAPGQDLFNLPESVGLSGKADGEPENQTVADLGSSSPSPTSLTTVEITYEVQYLLDHFKSHLIHMMLPMPQAASTSPWTNIFLRSALQALTGTSKSGYPSSKRRCLLYGILAMSAFHAEKVYNGPQNNNAGLLEQSGSGWWKWGMTYADLAKKELLSCIAALNGELNSQSPVEILGAFLALRATESTIGSIFDQQLSVQLCRRLFEIFDISIPDANHKFSITEYILLYQQVIQASMSSPSLQDPDDLSSQTRFPTLSDFPVRDYVSLAVPGPSAGIEPGILNFEDDERRLFVKLYGFPFLILRLLSETTNLAGELELFSSQHPDLATPSSLINQAQYLETRVLAEIVDTQYLASDTDTEAAHASLSLEISKAVHNSLIIYFFRRVRKTNPAILQRYVDMVLEGFVEQERMKLQNEIDTGFPLWSLLIAGCEAIGKDTQAIVINSLRQIGSCGFGVAEIAEIAIKELWRRRGAINEDICIQTVLRDLSLQLSLI